MTDAKQKLFAELQVLKQKMRVTKVVCTRSVKGKGGDHYVGFSATWDSVQDDSGGGGDLMSGDSGKGMTLRDARMAAYLLGMQADVAAHDAAVAGGNITEEYYDVAIPAIKANYTRHMLNLIQPGDGKEQ